MATPIRISYREGADYFIEAQGQSPPPLGRTIPQRMQQKLMAVVVVVALAFAVGSQIRQGTGLKIVASGTVFAILIMVFWYWFFKRVGLDKKGHGFEYQWTAKDRARLEKSYTKRFGSPEVPVVAEFDEDGFVLSSPNAAPSRHSWKGIVRVIERPKGMFVYFRSWMYFWFPKASFASKEDYQALTGIIARRVPRFERPDYSKMAFVALGSNLGNSAGTFNLALQRIQEFSDTPLIKSSNIQTAPVDCPPGSPDFLNAVAALAPRPSETPESLLTKLRALEREFGRRPKQRLNEPRPLDLDLIAFGNETRATAELTLPHPRAHRRRFVLRPLAEIAPELVLPGQNRTVAELLAGLDEAGGRDAA